MRSVGWFCPFNRTGGTILVEFRMPYQTPFSKLVYPDESGRPCSAQYRIAFADTQDRLAVIHIRHTIQADQSPASSSIVRDQILNRILDDDLKGVPVNFVRLVVESNGTSGMFASPGEHSPTSYRPISRIWPCACRATVATTSNGCSTTTRCFRSSRFSTAGRHRPTG